VIPAGAHVVFLGDGELDGTKLQDTLTKAGWSYVCRTAMSTVAPWEGETFRLETLGACLKPGAAERAPGSASDPGGLWSSDGAQLLGEGVSGAAVLAQ
jgi:hypothetical protein